MEKNPLHFFRIQKTDRYVRLKFGEFNIYFSWHPLKNMEGGKGRAWLAQDEEKVDETQTP